MDLLGIFSIISISVLFSTTLVYGQYGGGPPQSSAGDFTVSIHSDKDSYAVGDTILLSGSVNKYDEKRMLQITIFNSANKLILNAEILVEPDGTFSYDIPVDEKFSKIGQYTLRSQYGKTHVDVKIISFTTISADRPAESSQQDTNMESTPSTIPAWIKNNAGWWADDKIDDNSFVQGIQFLIKEGLMKISS